MKLIPLTRGLFAKVDDGDFDWLNQWKWHADRVPNSDKFRARREDESGKKIRMHRLIMNAPSNMWVDHKNHDPLDNQKHNLRVCKPLDNQRNRLKSASAKQSRFKGVQPLGHTYNKKPWRASLISNGVKVLQSYHSTEEEAARAYDAAAIKYFGEFACTNYPLSPTL